MRFGIQREFSVTESRIAVLTMFFINGSLLSNWVSRIPQVQRGLGLSEGELGLVLLGMSVGVITSLFFSGGLIARFGSRQITMVGAIGLCLSLILPGIAVTGVSLAASLFIFGGFMSMMDVAMNSQAVEVELRFGKPIMSSFHAAFSIGGFFGALMGAFVAGEAISVSTHFMVAAVVFLIISIIAAIPLVNVPVDKADIDGNPVFQLPQRALWGLGLIAFITAIGEGTATDWSAVYLERSLGTEPGISALGFAAFSLMMTVGRLSGDWITAKLNPVMMVRGGGFIAMVGFLIVVIVPETTVAIIGFGIAGAGLATLIPLAFSAAGRVPGIKAGTGIAGVATLGYAGFLVAPPIIGQIAERISLSLSLLLVALLLGVLIFIADAVQPRDKSKTGE